MPSAVARYGENGGDVTSSEADGNLICWYQFIPVEQIVGCFSKKVKALCAWCLCVGGRPVFQGEVTEVDALVVNSIQHCERAENVCLDRGADCRGLWGRE